MKSHNIVISRYWHKPKIDVFLMKNGIAIQLTVEDFVKSIAKELGTPKIIFSEKRFQEKLMDAAAQVLEKTKETSAVT